MATCQQCSTDFPDPIWPQTRGKYCSIRCNKLAYYHRHKARCDARTAQWCKDNRSTRLAVQRRWNQTPEAKRQKARWARRNAPQAYARMKAAGGIKVISARTLSRRRLRRAVPTLQCVCPPPHQGRIECHHRDGNPFNTQLENLEWRCVLHHRVLHRSDAPPLSPAGDQDSLHPDRRLDQTVE